MIATYFPELEGVNDRPAALLQAVVGRSAQLTAAWMAVAKQIIANTTDVGQRFAEEARKIHYNEAPERHIRGTATSQDVASLRDEGIDVVSLPVPPHLVNKIH